MDRYKLKVVDVTKVYSDNEVEKWTEANMVKDAEGPYVLYTDVLDLLTKGHTHRVMTSVGEP